MSGKGSQSRDAALPARDLKLVQIAHLQQRFELAPRSHLAEEVVRRTNKALAEHEAAKGAERLQPRPAQSWTWAGL